VIFVTDETMRLLVACTPSFNQKGFKMKINIGSMDRILRIIVGLALIALAAAGIIGVWGWIGVVPLLTGIFRFCPAYAVFGMSTCPMDKKTACTP